MMCPRFTTHQQQHSLYHPKLFVLGATAEWKVLEKHIQNLVPSSWWHKVVLHNFIDNAHIHLSQNQKCDFLDRTEYFAIGCLKWKHNLNKGGQSQNCLRETQKCINWLQCAQQEHVQHPRETPNARLRELGATTMHRGTWQGFHAQILHKILKTNLFWGFHQ